MTELMRAAIDKVSQRPCQCVTCHDCRGTGTIRVDMFSGLPKDGMDDLYDLEECPSCDGHAIVEMCDRCQEIEELYQMDEELDEYGRG